MPDENKLKRLLQITEWSEVDQDKALKIIEHVQKQELSKEEFSYLIKVVPSYLDLAGKAVVALQGVASSAATVQKAALENVGKAIDALKAIALHSTDSEFHKYCADHIMKALDMNKAMDESNSSFWTKAFGFVLVVLAGAAGVAGLRNGRSA